MIRNWPILAKSENHQRDRVYVVRIDPEGTVIEDVCSKGKGLSVAPNRRLPDPTMIGSIIIRSSSIKSRCSSDCVRPGLPISSRVPSADDFSSAIDAPRPPLRRWALVHTGVRGRELATYLGRAFRGSARTACSGPAFGQCAAKMSYVP